MACVSSLPVIRLFGAPLNEGTRFLTSVSACIAKSAPLGVPTWIKAVRDGVAAKYALSDLQRCQNSDALLFKFAEEYGLSTDNGLDALRNKPKSIKNLADSVAEDLIEKVEGFYKNSVSHNASFKVKAVWDKAGNTFERDKLKSKVKEKISARLYDVFSCNLEKRKFQTEIRRLVRGVDSSFEVRDTAFKASIYSAICAIGAFGLWGGKVLPETHKQMTDVAATVWQDTESVVGNAFKVYIKDPCVGAWRYVTTPIRAANDTLKKVDAELEALKHVPDELSQWGKEQVAAAGDAVGQVVDGVTSAAATVGGEIVDAAVEVADKTTDLIEEPVNTLGEMTGDVIAGVSEVSTEDMKPIANTVVPITVPLTEIVVKNTVEAATSDEAIAVAEKLGENVVTVAAEFSDGLNKSALPDSPLAEKVVDVRQELVKKVNREVESVKKGVRKRVLGAAKQATEELLDSSRRFIPRLRF